MQFNVNKKTYILLIILLILLGVISLTTMTLYMVKGFDNNILLISAIVFFILLITFAIAIQPSLTVYEKKALVNKLSKWDFKKIETEITLDNYKNILHKNGYHINSDKNYEHMKKVVEDLGEGIIDLYYNIIISKYTDELNLDSPIKEELYLSTSTYMWIIFSDNINDNILSKIKDYELKEIGRTKHRIFHRCCYYPVFLISNGFLYYLNFNKSSTNEFLKIIKSEK